MEKLMNVLEAATFLGLNPQSVYKLIRSGGIPHMRVGRRIRFNIEELKRWAEHPQKSQGK